MLYQYSSLACNNDFKMKDKKIVIIGGGAAGVSAAAFALKNGFKDVTIVESSNSLGGFHRNTRINDLNYDLGAFFFGKGHNLLNLFPDVEKNLVHLKNAKNLSLTNQFNLDRYPLTLNLYLRENGIVTFIVDLVKLFWYRIFNLKEECVNVDQILNYYMGAFYEKSGLKNYIRRLYGMEPNLISAEFASKRITGVIEKFRLVNIFKSILRFNFGELANYQIDGEVWARPEGGFGIMYDQIELSLLAIGCHVLLEEKVVSINYVSKNVQTDRGKILNYDYLLSSQSLSLTGEMAKIPFEGILRHRRLCSLFYEIEFEPIPDCFVLYNFSERGRWKRVTFHSNYYSSMGKNESKKSYFVVESMPDDAQLRPNEIWPGLNNDFIDTFRNTKWELAFKNATLVGHLITNNAYPILDLEFDRNSVLSFKRKLRELDIYLIGRQGEFEYVSSGDASELAVNAIKDIMNSSGLLGN
jgi:protoporphyrinogen oxidase